jgi:chromodomain-containing protein
MPRFDGPYVITGTNPKHSTVSLDLPHKPNQFPVFHTSELRPFNENDSQLFAKRALNPPELVIINGEREFFIDKIVDEHRRRNQLQYRVRWQGEGPEGDKWLPASELEDCEALNVWQMRQRDDQADNQQHQLDDQHQEQVHGECPLHGLPPQNSNREQNQQDSNLERIQGNARPDEEQQQNPRTDIPRSGVPPPPPPTPVGYRALKPLI